jgi:hypothetical protein
MASKAVATSTMAEGSEHLGGGNAELGETPGAE